MEFQGVRFLRSDCFIEIPSDKENVLTYLYGGTSETIVIAVKEREKAMFLPIRLCNRCEEVYFTTAVCGSLKGNMYITKNETVIYQLELPYKILEITITQMRRFITDELYVLDFLDSLTY